MIKTIEMELFYELQNSLQLNRDRNAFFINNETYTYGCFASMIFKIRRAIQETIKSEEKNIGLILNDDLETYASIIAIWFEGKAYVPVNPDSPKERNNKILLQADIKTLIDSSKELLYQDYNLIIPSTLMESSSEMAPVITADTEFAYIFFTSGTTGEPKGVPITRGNVSGFVNAFREMKLNINKEDRVLQMFELTFDLSVMSYLIPLLHGACVYLIPKNKIKYNYIYELMDEQKLTVALMVPSILHYLRQYFDEINLPDMRYSLFCGEALPLDVTEEWSRCLPNAEIYNVYGPTENTIFCTVYKYDPHSGNKAHNGILSIGKAMTGVKTIIIDDNNNILSRGQKGELCLAGELLTPGYWKNESKNIEAFFSTEYEGSTTRFYKTGDLCLEDSDGDLLYLGRIDFQTKIQGFRVELSEVEFHAKTLIEKNNIAAIAYTNAIGNTEIGLAVESNEFDTKEFIDKLKLKLPSYMLPSKIMFYKSFPLNTNGKTDRKELKVKFEKN